MARSHREVSRHLYEIAGTQQGFFTTNQAKVAGYRENTHTYHVKVGNWVREHRGIYRLVQYPAANQPDLVRWSLWSRNRRQEVQGGQMLPGNLQELLSGLRAGDQVVSNALVLQNSVEQ